MKIVKLGAPRLCEKALPVRTIDAHYAELASIQYRMYKTGFNIRVRRSMLR